MVIEAPEPCGMVLELDQVNGIRAEGLYKVDLELNAWRPKNRLDFSVGVALMTDPVRSLPVALPLSPFVRIMSSSE